MGLTAGVRPAHVAGAFYPGNAEALAAEVATLLEAARAQAVAVPDKPMAHPNDGPANA